MGIKGSGKRETCSVEKRYLSSDDCELYDIITIHVRNSAIPGSVSFDRKSFSGWSCVHVVTNRDLRIYINYMYITVGSYKIEEVYIA